MGKDADENGAVELPLPQRIEDFIVRKNEELRAENKRLIERLAYLEKEVILFHTYANTPAPQTAEKALLLGDQKWLEQGKALKAAEAELERLRQQNAALTAQLREALVVVGAAREWHAAVFNPLSMAKHRLAEAVRACTLGEMVETGEE